MSNEVNDGMDETKGATKTPNWHVKLNKDELLSQKCDATPLFAALISKARQLEHSYQDLCRHLETSYPYFNQLRRGSRQLTVTSLFLEKSAEYLGLPRLSVLGLARLITVDDLEEKPQEVISLLPRAFQFVTDDPKWQHLVDSHVLNSPFEVRYFIVRLYEAATDTRLLPERLEPERLAKELKKLNQLIESLIDSESTD